MFREGLKIGRILGITIQLDYSWFIIFLLVTWNLVAGVLPAIQPGWATELNLAVGILTSVLFFASLLAHELAHAVMANRRGLSVSKITLFLFGGVAHLEDEPDSPLTEFLVAIVGPIMSLAIGGIAIFLGLLSMGLLPGLFLRQSAITVTELTPLATVFAWLGPINILIAVFNMIPGFPLDGGRVFRSLLWAVTGNLEKATWYASGAGQLTASFFMLMGALMIFGYQLPLLGSGMLGGFWLVFIGWFLYSAASQSYQQMVLRSMLENVSAAELMRVDLPQASPNLTVQELVSKYLVEAGQSVIPVIGDKEMTGVVGIREVQGLDKPEWKHRQVGEIMTPKEKLPSVPMGKKLSKQLMKYLVRGEEDPLLVTDPKNESRVIGIIDRSDIMRWLQLQPEGKKLFT
jgi:Zn-dependent protease/predicted transcriptional regulator